MRGFVLVLTLAGTPRPAPDGWLGEDKLRHFFTAAFVQSMGYGTMRAAGAGHAVALTAASAATAGVSVGKEVWDAGGRGSASARDLAWDAAGAGAASVLLVRVRR